MYKSEKRDTAFSYPDTTLQLPYVGSGSNVHIRKFKKCGKFILILSGLYFIFKKAFERALLFSSLLAVPVPTEKDVI